MGKKVAFTKGSNKVNFKKNPLTVKTNSQQKKPKAVKTHVKKVTNQIKSDPLLDRSIANVIILLGTFMKMIIQIFQLKANVTAQQESADKRLKDLHVQMTVKQTRTVDLKKKDKKPAADTSAVHANLEKMQV